MGPSLETAETAPESIFDHIVLGFKSIGAAAAEAEYQACLAFVLSKITPENRTVIEALATGAVLAKQDREYEEKYGKRSGSLHPLGDPSTLDADTLRARGYDAAGAAGHEPPAS